MYNVGTEVDRQKQGRIGKVTESLIKKDKVSKQDINFEKFFVFKTFYIICMHGIQIKTVLFFVLKPYIFVLLNILRLYLFVLNYYKTYTVK